MVKEILSEIFNRVSGKYNIFLTGLPPGAIWSPLTPGEVVFIRSVFGDRIDPSAIRKYFEPVFDGNTVASTFDGAQVVFYGLQHHSADYSRDRSAYRRGAFMHEMTHIWQNQAQVACEKGGTYVYELSAQRRFRDYGMEQQASIIEDYVRRFLHSGGGAASHRFLNAGGKDTPQTDALLQKVVEDHFPAAGATRLALGMNRSNGLLARLMRKAKLSP